MTGYGFKGYGRAWTEEKATGFARLLQIGREPATKTTYIVCGAIALAIWFCVAVFLAA